MFSGFGYRCYKQTEGQTGFRLSRTLYLGLYQQRKQVTVENKDPTLEAGTKRGGGTTWISGPIWITLLARRYVFSYQSDMKSHFRRGFVQCKVMLRKGSACSGEEEEGAVSFWAASHAGLLKLSLIKSAAQNVIKLASEQIALTLVGWLPRFILPRSMTALSAALPRWTPSETPPKTRRNEHPPLSAGFNSTTPL